MTGSTHEMTDQVRRWTGTLGLEYTDRNDQTPCHLDEFYQNIYGKTRSELNQRFLDNVPRNAPILEVGCNVGTKLLLLKEMGFTDLSGLEIQEYALQRAQERLGDAKILQASALSIPFPDQQFELVFTSGVLIHIAPADLPIALTEIHRCTRKWVWGMEYFAPQMEEIIYRDNRNLLWKADYARLYQHHCADLELVREEDIPYPEGGNIDSMFLLERKG